VALHDTQDVQQDCLEPEAAGIGGAAIEVEERNLELARCHAISSDPRSARLRKARVSVWGTRRSRGRLCPPGLRARDGIVRLLVGRLKQFDAP
jgi:hypothetical protein